MSKLLSILLAPFKVILGNMLGAAIVAGVWITFIIIFTVLAAIIDVIVAIA